MDIPQDPQLWNLRQWLAFLLLMASDVDGERSHAEMRPIRVELGNEVVDAMLLRMEGLSNTEKEAILHDSLPHFVNQKGAREKLQRILFDAFLADGEYGPAEQAMTHKIGEWIRAAGN